MLLLVISHSHALNFVFPIKNLILSTKLAACHFTDWVFLDDSTNSTKDLIDSSIVLSKIQKRINGLQFFTPFWLFLCSLSKQITILFTFYRLIYWRCSWVYLRNKLILHLCARELSSGASFWLKNQWAFLITTPSVPK